MSISEGVDTSHRSLSPSNSMVFAETVRSEQPSEVETSSLLCLLYARIGTIL